MKLAIKIMAMAGILLFIQACDKDDINKIKIQNHDDNEMMTIMHNMMDEMMAMQMPPDPDIAFGLMMRMHHQGAIDMANKELQSGDDAQMREMAQKMIKDQKAEIQELTTFLNGHVPHLNVPEFVTEQMKNMERSGRVTDLQIINGDTDHDFAMLMIQHHQNAIENATLELIYGHESAMQTMAKNIIEKQDQEISEIQTWLLANKNR